MGDYIFSDIDFVRSLKAGDRNLFQRIYDEIKHLAKLATAGSKEARELEKVKKLFADVYREAGAEKSTAKDGGVQYSISKDVNGNSFVDVTEDIFDANNGESIARVIQKVIAEKFHNIIDVHGQKIQINKTTNDEFRRSNSANELMSSNPQAYNDKLKTIANADEILRIARNWIGEEKKHNRKDDIVEFARGNVAYRVGLNGYIADVIVGTRKNGSAVLYDLVNIYEKEITEAPVTVASKNNSQRRQDASAEEIITQPNATVKREMSPFSDNEYLRIVNQGDTKAAQKMVEKAAKEAGYTVKAYHGTDAGEFHEFNKGRIGEASGLSILGDGFYFSDRESTAKQYGKNVFPVYLKQLNPYNATAGDAYKLNALELERQGYDSVILQTGKGKVLMVLDPNQVKSAAPITYDENGNVIPLSERFNPKSNDMRYSLSQEEMAAADTAYDPKQIYGKDVRMEAPVAAQTKTGVAGIEGPLPDQMPKARPIDSPGK